MNDSDRRDGTAGGDCSLVVVDPSREGGFEPTAVADRTDRGVFVTTPDQVGALPALAGADRDPLRIGHVDVGAGGVRSATRTATDGAGDPFTPDGAGARAREGLASDDGPDWYSRVADPLDLPGIAGATDRHATRVADAADADGVDPAAVAVHLDAVTGLADRTDDAPLLRFLRVLTGRVRSLGATGYAYLVAPVDAAVVRRVEPVFDAVFEVDDDVRARDAASAPDAA